MVSGFSDDVSHIVLGRCHGRCARTMSRGLETRVLEGAKTWSIDGSGCESLEGVHHTGFVDGDWDSELVMRKWSLSLDDTRCQKVPFFLCYILYIEQWGFHYFILQDHRERCPPSFDALDRHVCVEVSTT